MNAALENYLETVSKRLKPLPAVERADIIKEVETSMLEMERDGLAPAQILERLGDPKALARAYLGDKISTGKGFTWNRFLTIFAFYGLVGLSGIVVIPTLAIISPVFIASGVFAILAGVYKLIDQVFRLGLPFAQYINGMSVNGVPLLGPGGSFVVTAVTGALLCAAGYGCWRGLQYYMKKLSRTKKDLAI